MKEEVAIIALQSMSNGSENVEILISCIVDPMLNIHSHSGKTSHVAHDSLST